MNRLALGAGALVALSGLLVGCAGPAAGEANRERSEISDGPTSSYTPFDRTQGERAVTRCLHEEGIDATFDASGGVEMSGARSQAAAQDALARCERSAGFPSLEGVTTDQLAYLYRETAKERNCLIRHGESLRDMPSWKDFESTYLEDPYLPYKELSDLPASRLSALEKVCPQPDL